VRERRLAISIKGGVSLGAYEAGALYETLRLIGYNNSQPDPNRTNWFIDVLSGASAGSVTAAMVAAALVNQNLVAVNKNTNSLLAVWVQQLSLAALLPPQNSSNPADNYYLLSAASLDTLAERNFPFPAAISRHPALRSGDADLRLRFALSRVNPIVTTIKTQAGASLDIEQYAESASFFITVDPNNAFSIKASGVAPPGYSHPDQTLIGGDAWIAFQQAAIASGTFPMAFAPRKLRMWDQQHQWRDATFIDGGLFDNDPVGQAINLAHDIDWYSRKNYDDKDRRYLIIHTAPSTPPALLPNVPDSYALLVNLVGSLLTESTTSGLRGIIDVDKQFAQRSAFLGALTKQIGGGSALALLPELLEQLAEWRGIKVPEQLNFLRGSLIPDLAQTDPAIFATVNQFDQAQKDNFSGLALAMDLALNLADKVTIDPILIAPQPAAQNTAILAGEGLYGFAGFLVPDFRARDYAQGRYDAWETWKSIALNGQEEFAMPAVNDSRYPPPIAPETAIQVIAENKALYDQGSNQLFARIDVVADAIAKGAAAGSGLLAPLEQQIARVIIDALARKLLQ
jgi:predicted acylesterase/phospholipase RssA